MKNDAFQKLIYQLVSKLFVLPIYKFVFRGHLIGIENIPQKNAFIMVSNHGSLLDPPLLGHALRRNISFMAKAELFKVANREIAPMREKYDHLMANKSEIDQLLIEGAKKVRPMAQKNLQKIKKVIGVSNV